MVSMEYIENKNANNIPLMLPLIELEICIECGKQFRLNPKARIEKKFCSKHCYDVWFYKIHREQKRQYDKQYMQIPANRIHRNKWVKQWLDKHPEKRTEYNKRNSIRYREKNKARGRLSNEKLKKSLIEKFGSKCSRCGYDKYLGALEFHHINPEETEKPSSWRHYDLSKVVLVCANCHREIHHELKQKEITGI
jgi:predicted HNH restriction endonuclease